jgi:hypothetical protein
MRRPVHLIKEETVLEYLANFSFAEEDNRALDPDNRTFVDTITVQEKKIPRFINQFWTSRQRQASSIHEISYRACFKPQLPRFFIKLLSRESDPVYDPFSGRGTTVIEAALLGRKVISNDINPLSRIMALPRLEAPALAKIKERLATIPISDDAKAGLDLSMFYHPRTEAEIVSIRNYLEQRRSKGCEDAADRWIRMTATNRLTGHSKGFFSVYTLPPNQAVSPESQVKINLKRNQEPDYRNTKSLIYRKSKSLIRNLDPAELQNLHNAGASALFLENDACRSEEIAANSVQLTVTSPPFLNIVQYSRDNWLRCWFNHINTAEIEQKITMTAAVEEWSAVMKEVFQELFRITRNGGWVAFEVGEVRHGKIKLEEYIIPVGLKAGFNCTGVVINRQQFTKTAHIWGIKNNAGGTNTNRIVLFNKI